MKAAIDYADNPDKTTAPEFVDNDLYAALRYTGNDSKTDQKMYVTGINCGKFTAYEEMIAVNGRSPIAAQDAPGVYGYYRAES